MSHKTLPRTGPHLAGGDGPYGQVGRPGESGLALPRGFTGRVVARSGAKVAGLTWHAAPDGGACSPTATAGSTCPTPSWPCSAAPRRCGERLCFSTRHGRTEGLTFEVTGPFRA